MATSVDELANEFDQLLSTYKEIEEAGKQPGKSSLVRAVKTQVGIMSNAVHRSMIDCGALTYAKQYGAVKPARVAHILRQIASAIDNSQNPSRKLVVEDIQRVIANINAAQE